MLHRPPRARPGRRQTTSLGLLLGIGVLVTSASLTTLRSVDVELSAAPTFALGVAGSTDLGWEPAADDWLPSGGASYPISSGDEVLRPGDSVTRRVAVRNESPVLDARVTVRLVSRSTTDVDLFDVLRFSVRTLDGVVLVDDVPGALVDGLPVVLDPALGSGSSTVLDITYRLPTDADPAFQGGATVIEVGFDGAST